MKRTNSGEYISETSELKNYGKKTYKVMKIYFESTFENRYCNLSYSIYWFCIKSFSISVALCNLPLFSFHFFHRFFHDQKLISSFSPFIPFSCGTRDFLTAGSQPAPPLPRPRPRSRPHSTTHNTTTTTTTNHRLQHHYSYFYFRQNHYHLFIISFLDCGLFLPSGKLQISETKETELGSW